MATKEEYREALLIAIEALTWISSDSQTEAQDQDKSWQAGYDYCAANHTKTAEKAIEEIGKVLPKC